MLVMSVTKMVRLVVREHAQGLLLLIQPHLIKRDYMLETMKTKLDECLISNKKVKTDQLLYRLFSFSPVTGT